MVGTDRPQMTM